MGFLVLKPHQAGHQDAYAYIFLFLTKTVSKPPKERFSDESVFSGNSAPKRCPACVGGPYQIQADVPGGAK
jgi:hypothetical protein